MRGARLCELGKGEMSFEVSEPILNTPFEKPKEYWDIQEGEEPQKRPGRHPPVVLPPRDHEQDFACNTT